MRRGLALLLTAAITVPFLGECAQRHDPRNWKPKISLVNLAESDWQLYTDSLAEDLGIDRFAQFVAHPTQASLTTAMNATFHEYDFTLMGTPEEPELVLKVNYVDPPAGYDWLGYDIQSHMPLTGYAQGKRSVFHISPDFFGPRPGIPDEQKDVVARSSFLHEADHARVYHSGMEFAGHLVTQQEALALGFFGVWDSMKEARGYLVAIKAMHEMTGEYVTIPVNEFARHVRILGQARSQVPERFGKLTPRATLDLFLETYVQNDEIGRTAVLYAD